MAFEYRVAETRPKMLCFPGQGRYLKLESYKLVVTDALKSSGDGLRGNSRKFRPASASLCLFFVHQKHGFSKGRNYWGIPGKTEQTLTLKALSY